jgi:hypothetical protein
MRFYEYCWVPRGDSSRGYLWKCFGLSHFHKYHWTRLAVLGINLSDMLRRSSPHGMQVVASLPSSDFSHVAR